MDFVITIEFKKKFSRYRKNIDASRAKMKPKITVKTEKDN